MNSPENNYQNSGEKYESLIAWMLVAWLLGWWWLGKQYQGLAQMNDGALYTAEALKHLSPASFTNDVFLSAQSQGQFSVFTPLYAWLIDGVGLKPAGLWVSSAGRVVWAGAAVFLAKALWAQQAKQQEKWAGLLGLAAMLLLPSTYDGFSFFSYGSTQVTPRTWAEALVMLALALRWRQQPLWAWGVALLAAVMHPLMALPGLGLLVLLEPPKIRYAFLAVGALVGAIGAAAQLGPLGQLGQLLHSFDEVWWESVVILTGYVLIQTWPTLALAKAVFWLLLLAYVGYVSRPLDASLNTPIPTIPPIRRLARSLLWLGVLMLAAWCFASVTQNVLLLQIQPWRVLWLMQLLAPALWLCTLPHWRGWNYLDWAQVLLVLAGILAPATFILLIAALGLLLGHPLARQRLSEFEQRSEAPVLAAIVLLIALAMRLPEYFLIAENYQRMQFFHAVWVSFAGEAMWMLIVFAGLLFLLKKLLEQVPTALAQDPSGGLPRLLLAWCVLALLPLGLSVSVLLLQIQKAQRPFALSQELQQKIPQGALIYWDLGTYHTWFVLRRADYLAETGVSSLFSRPAAMEYRRRVDSLADTGVFAAAPDEAQTPEAQEPIPLVSAQRQAQARQFAQRVERMNQLRSVNLNSILLLCRDPLLDHVLLSADIPEADARAAYASAPGGVVSIFNCKHAGKP